MYDFAIQASNPTVISATGQRVKTLASAIPAIFPVTTEEAYMLWNRVPVRISYKYDLYVLIDDIPPMLSQLLDRDAGTHEFGWGSSTFSARWQLNWSEGQLRIAARWRSVAGGYESLLNTRSELVFGQNDFVYEWKALLACLLRCIDTSGIHITREQDLATIRELEAAIPRFGRYYTQE